MKNKKAEAVNFGTHKNINQFLTTFNSTRSYPKFQCFNCEVWKSAPLLNPIGQFDQSAGKLFVFRFCADCWRSYQKVSPELKQDFIRNIRLKLQTVAEVKI
jgi:hypothetical protein